MATGDKLVNLDVLKNTVQKEVVDLKSAFVRYSEEYIEQVTITAGPDGSYQYSSDGRLAVASRNYTVGNILFIGNRVYRARTNISSGATITDSSVSLVRLNDYIGGTGSATGMCAHAEGMSTTASGVGDHAEGRNTTASGSDGSHSEGYMTEASGAGSHAEGRNTIASGTDSHAEGTNTTAKHKAQHVFGTYNVSDPSTESVTSKGTYVEIVGNGTSTTKLSNARTLDWSGNESLAGSMILGKGSDHETIISPRMAENLTVLISALGLIRVNLSIPEAIDRLVNMLESWTGGAFGDSSGNYGTAHGATPATSMVYFYQQPKDRTIQEGNLTVMEVNADGADSYQWQYSDDDGTTWTDCDSSFIGRKTIRLAFQATAAMNGWKFRCCAIASQGTVTVYSREATLTVTAAS